MALGRLPSEGERVPKLAAGFWMGCPKRSPYRPRTLTTGRRRPRSPCHLPAAVAARPVRRPPIGKPGEPYPIGGMFQLLVDDEIALVLAEERHAQAMTDLIKRNQGRLARWEPWAEQPATVEGTRAYIRAALEDFVRGRQISTIIALERGRRFVGRCGIRINPYA